MKNRAILHLLLILTIISCGKSDLVSADGNQPSIPGNQDISVKYSLSERTILFTDDMAKAVMILDPENIVFAETFPKDKLPSDGDIIVIPPSKSCPDGLIGRISFGTKVETTTCKVEPVSLEEAFTELDIEGNIDMSQYITSLEDEEGNVFEAKIVDDKIWNQFDTTQTKAGAVNVTKPIEVNISNAFFNGKFYLNTTLNVDIKIHQGKMEICRINTTNKGGFSGEFKFEFGKGEKKFPFVAASVPVPLGPIALKPTLNLKVGITLEGHNELKLNVDYILLHERIGVNYDGTQWSSERKKLDGAGGTKTLLKWEMDGSAKLSVDVSLRYCIFNENVLAAGVGFRPYLKLSGEFAISPSMKTLLEANPEVEFEQGVEVFVFAYARILKNTHLDRYELSYAPVASRQTLNLLTAFNNMKIHRSGKSITVSGQPEIRSAMKQDEYGIALFRKGNDNPTQHQKFGSATKSGEQNQVTFSNLDDESQFEVKSYVVAQEGTYYYAPINEAICSDINHVHAIDLGLSVKWACCNVGATKPEEYGGYYAWGEAVWKSVYNEVTYKYAHGIDSDGDGFYDPQPTPADGEAAERCYFDYIGSDISGTPYDVAHNKWGGSWRMPTLAEFDELINNCYSEWTILNGTNGIKFTSKKNGNSIFLPAGGNMRIGPNSVGNACYYWSSSLNTDLSGSVWCGGGDPYGAGTSYNDRYNGLSVRPVSK